MADSILILAFSASLFIRVMAVLGKDVSEACVVHRREPCELATGPPRQGRKLVMDHERFTLGDRTASGSRSS